MERLKTADARPFDFTSRTVMFHYGGVMPLNGLGIYALKGDVCIKAVKDAPSNGVCLFDTVFMYGNEAEAGRAIRESGVPRNEVFVITKIYSSQFGNSKAAINDSVRKLDTSYIDLMRPHHPSAGDVNAYHVIEEAVKTGKVHHLGMSN